MKGLKKTALAGVILYVSAGVFFYINSQCKQSKFIGEIKKRARIASAPAHIGITELKDKRLALFPGEKLSFYLNAQEKIPAASLIKLPIMAVCFKAAKDGKIKLSGKIILKQRYKTGGSGILKNMPAGRRFTIEKLINLMITISDNTAANILISKLGRPYINRIFKYLGLKQTRLNRRILDLSARRKGIENYTSIQDLIYLLKKIYNKKLISPQYCQKMLNILLKQKINGRLPKYLPKNLKIAHKTGLARNIVADAGIIFAPNADYIIAVAFSGKPNYKTAKQTIAKISLKTYEYFRQ